MERLEGGRIKIVGQKPTERNRTPVRRSPKDEAEHRCNFQSYFDSVVYQDSTPEAIKVFAPRTVFIGCMQVSESPRRRPSLVVNINGPYHGAFQPQRGRGTNAYSFVEPTPWARRESENVITIKFDEKPFYRGYFYVSSKTLVIGTVLADHRGPEYLQAIMEYLVANGHLVARPRTEAPVQLEAESQYKKGVEFHNGQRVYVRLPLPRATCKVGCDPEFEYVQAGRPTQAPNSYRSLTGEIGLDGAGSQIEIRPKAFEKPSDVVSYMIGIMRRMDDAHLSTKGDRYPLGGHVHVGVPGGSYAPPADLLFLLDFFLGKPTINLSGTARSSYRALGKFESKPWGFEYRSAPAAIFHWPEFARLAMKICKFVTEAYINAQTIIVNAEPTFEDYWNYCGLFPREYERWQHSWPCIVSSWPTRKHIARTSFSSG